MFKFLEPLPPQFEELNDASSYFLSNDFDNLLWSDILAEPQNILNTNDDHDIQGSLPLKIEEIEPNPPEHLKKTSIHQSLQLSLPLPISTKPEPKNNRENNEIHTSSTPQYSSPRQQPELPTPTPTLSSSRSRDSPKSPKDPLQPRPQHSLQSPRKKLKSSGETDIDTSSSCSSSSSSPYNSPRQHAPTPWDTKLFDSSEQRNETTPEQTALLNIKNAIALLDPTTRLLMKEGLYRLSQKTGSGVLISEKTPQEREIELNLETNVLNLLYNGNPEVLSPASPSPFHSPRASPMQQFDSTSYLNNQSSSPCPILDSRKLPTLPLPPASSLTNITRLNEGQRVDLSNLIRSANGSSQSKFNIDTRPKREILRSNSCGKIIKSFASKPVMASQSLPRIDQVQTSPINFNSSAVFRPFVNQRPIEFSRQFPYK